MRYRSNLLLHFYRVLNALPLTLTLQAFSMKVVERKQLDPPNRLNRPEHAI